MAEVLRRVRPLGPMDERWVQDPNSASYISNMYVDSDGAWRSAGGLRAAFTYPTSNPVYSISQFHQGRRQWTLLEYENTSATSRPYKYLNLAYIDHANDALVDIETGRARVEGPWAGTSFTEIGQWVYAVNGYDAPARWNGREYLPAGHEAIPPAPTVSITDENQMGGTELAPGLGEFEERWTYGWAISTVNDAGAISPPSAISYLRGVNPTGGGGPTAPRRLSALIVTSSFPKNIRGVILWRTANVEDVSTVGQQGAALYFVKAFPTGGQITYVDGARDTALLEELDRDAVGLFPAKATALRLFKGSLFAAVGNRVQYSHPQHVEQFPDINYVPIGDETSGYITGMVATKNALVVFKERGIYLVRGNQAQGFRADTLTEDVGHMAGQNALREIPGVGVVFWNEAGPYVLIGALENTGTPTEWRFIGQGLARTWKDRINTKALPSIRAEVNHADRELWVLVPEGGDDRATLGLVYHYETGGWSIRPGYGAQCVTATRGHRARMLFGLTAGGVSTYTHAENPPSLPEYRSAWLDLGGERTQVRHVKLDGLTIGADYQFEWRVDRHPVGWATAQDDRLQGDDYERELPKWGAARWDTASWYEEYPTGVRFDLYQCNGFTLQWRARGNRIAISGADVFFVPSATHVKERNG